MSEGHTQKAAKEAKPSCTVRIAGWPRGFVHRDYQSRNLMLKGGELVVIDFQDALLGPRVFTDLRQVIEKAGFQREGVLRERYIYNGEVQDVVYYGLLAREFARGRAKVDWSRE